MNEINEYEMKNWFKTVLDNQDQVDKDNYDRQRQTQRKVSNIQLGFQTNTTNVGHNKIEKNNINNQKITTEIHQSVNKKNKVINVDKVKTLKQQQKKLDTMGAILGLAGLVTSVIEFELFHKQNFKSEWYNDVLRGFITITTLILVGTICKGAYFSYLIQIEKETISIKTNFYVFNLDKEKKTNAFKIMLLEVILNIVHCPPMLDNTFYVNNINVKIELSVDGCTMSFMLLRVYLLGRLFAHYSKWLNDFAQEKAEQIYDEQRQVNYETNITFAIKAELKVHPNQTIILLMIISCVVFGLAVRHFEQAYYKNTDKTQIEYQDYGQVINSFWLIMITMMTVGFGDYYPRTHLGRAICIIACFWGVFIVSMMVVTLTNATTLSQKEERSFGILYRLHVKESIKNKAATVIIRLFKIKTFNKQMKDKLMNKKAKVMRLKLHHDLMDALVSFKEEKRKLVENQPTAEETLRQITEQMDRDLNDIMKSMNRINLVRESLQEIEGSQDIILTVINEVLKISNSIDEVLMKFRFHKH